MKNIYSILLIALLIIGTSLNMNAQCKAKQMVKEYKPLVVPYTYDSYGLNEIVYDSVKSSVVEVEFIAFSGVKYRLVFCSSGLEKEIKLNIYDKSKRVKTRKKIYTTESGADGKWVFEIAKAGKYFIDYEIPPVKQKGKKNGCMIVLIGYK